MTWILGIVVFAVAMALLSYVLRRMEREGDFDPQSPSTSARPGVRRFFDYSERGFKRDGIRQRPPEK